MPNLEENPINESALMLWKHNEFLAHRLPVKLQRAYDKKALPVAIFLQDSDGVEREYFPQKVEGVHAGLVCFILQPVSPDNSRIHVIFRGTHNLKSAQRDLKLNGPGTASFAQNSGKILAAIEEAVAQIKVNSAKQKVSLTMGGHSLGGADAQNCASRVLKEIALDPKGILASSIGTINLIHKNSPGISHKSAAVAKASVEAIKSNRNTSHIKINYFPILIARDFVQKAGYTSLLNDMEADQVKTQLLKADLGKNSKVSYWALLFDGPITWFKHIINNMVMIHKFKIFDEYNDTTKTVNAEVKLEIFENNTPEGKLAINKELQNKTLQAAYKNITNTLPSKKALVNKFTTSKAKVSPQPMSTTTKPPKFSKDN